MIWNKYFWPSFLLIIIIAFLHWIALDKLFYWTVWWYDIMMHFLGGFWVAIFSLWIINMPFSHKWYHLSNIKNILIITFIVGFLWEVYELVFGMTDFYKEGYMNDTIKDLIMDMIGAFVAFKIFKNKNISENA